MAHDMGSTEEYLNQVAELLKQEGDTEGQELFQVLLDAAYGRTDAA